MRRDTAHFARDGGALPEAYPLTPMQQAYWIGEKQGYRLSTAASLYRGFRTPQLDPGRLEQALLRLLVAHPALRTCVREDGRQFIAALPARVEVPVRDLRHLDVAEQEASVARRQNAVDEGLPPIDGGCQFACFVDRVHDGHHVHLLFRLMVLDGRSFAIFFQDLACAYRGQELEAPTAPYRAYAEQQDAARLEPAYQRALEHWSERLRTLPPAPDLPIADLDAVPQRSVFRRLQVGLEPDAARQLTLRCRKLGVTPNALLCTLFADVLRMWSRQAAFTLNLLISGRSSDDGRFDRTIGNFSNTLLLEVPVVQGGLRERAIALQRQLFREIEHAQVAGVDVIRRMNRPASSLPAMPVVFASSLGLEQGGSVATPAELGWRPVPGSMHTPQVWLDHQAYMDEGRLVLNWDYVEGVFAHGMVEEMFEVYGRELRQLLSVDDAAVLAPRLPEAELAARRRANDTARPLPQGLLQDFFAQACGRHPSHAAIIAPGVQLSYRELNCRTTHLAGALRRHGLGRNDLVAIVARRGWRQVAAAMATVQSGAAYLPVAHGLPQARKQWLIEQAGVKAVLCERDGLADLNVPAGVVALALEDALPDAAPAEPVELAPIQHPHDLAYVIYTSGSTGQPKGVAIDHRGAVNTLQDVIARFGLDEHDRVIGLSAFNFDLSVYDIFATLGQGAALVLPPHGSGPAPADWARCLQDHRVTVWNSVPALLEMQLEYSAAHTPGVFAHLRLIMLSGDWIPVSLPARVAAVAPQARLIGLGGATEASIWSNYFVIDRVDPKWHSIPYGWPLSNQCFHVLDDAMQPRPTGVVGHLYIGGIGLAQGYHRDPERTAQSFVTHPDSGERLYRTGDLGRYRRDGCLEFLGRSDTQVKVDGHRIELGEIESVLERCPGVRSAAALIRKVGEQGRPQLVAFYVADAQACAGAPASAAAVRQFLGEQLPPYMVPGLLQPIPQLPVTANGKIDRAALQAQAQALQVARRQPVPPRNATELVLAGLWKDLLGQDDLGVEDDFFAAGGSSLLAVRLLNAIEATFGQTLTLASLLRQGTIATQARLVTELAAQAPRPHARPGGAREAVVRIRRGTPAPGPQQVLVAVHPVGGNVLCYRELAQAAPAEMDILAIQSRGDGAARTVPEMAAAYVAELLPHLPPAARVHLLGWSMGGVVAHEMTRLLEAGGASVAGLTMIDSWVGDPALAADAAMQGVALLKNFARDLLQATRLAPELESLDRLPEAEQRAAARVLLGAAGAGPLTAEDFERLLAEHEANFNALIRHRPQPTGIAPLHFRATQRSDFPFLVPFPASASRDPARPATALDATHFSIVRGACLRLILDRTTLAAGALA